MLISASPISSIPISAAPEPFIAKIWQPQALPPARRRLAQSTVIVEPIDTTAAPVVEVYGWDRPTNVPVLRARRTNTHFDQPLEPSLFTEPPLESWNRDANPLPHQYRRGQPGGDVRPLEPSLVVEPASQTWMRPTNLPVLPLRRPSLGYIDDLAAWTPGTLTVDKWFMPASMSLHRPEHVVIEQYVQPLEPSLFVEPNPMTWMRETNLPVLPRVYARTGIVIDMAWFPEPITVDKWFNQTSEPLFQKQRPAIGAYERPLEPSVTEQPPPLSWYSTGSDLVRRPGPRQASVFDSAALYPFTPEVAVSIDWYTDHQTAIPRPMPSLAGYARPERAEDPYEWFVEPPVQSRAIRLVYPDSPYVFYFETPAAITTDWLPASPTPLTSRALQRDTSVSVIIQGAPELSWVSHDAPVPRGRPSPIQWQTPFFLVESLIPPIPICPYIPLRTDEEVGLLGRTDFGFESTGRADDNAEYRETTQEAQEESSRVEEEEGFTSRADQTFQFSNRSDESVSYGFRQEVDESSSMRSEESESASSRAEEEDGTRQSTSEEDEDQQRRDECT